MNMQQPQELETLGKSSAAGNSPSRPRRFLRRSSLAECCLMCLKQGVTFPRLPASGNSGDELDLTQLPLIRPYPGDAGKIITLGLVITN